MCGWLYKVVHACMRACMHGLVESEGPCYGQWMVCVKEGSE